MTKKIELTVDPFLNTPTPGRWPANWIAESVTPETGFQVTAYRLQFSLSTPIRVRLHVSADERYELYIDGQRVGRGPERGDERNWFFETREIALQAGPHIIVARTWWLGPGGKAPLAQRSIRPAFLLAADGEGIVPQTFNTGQAGWECMRLSGYESLPFHDAWGTGSKLRVIGEQVDWGFASGHGAAWRKAVVIDPAFTAAAADTGFSPWLRPAVLPEMLHELRDAIIARHVAVMADPAEPFKTPIAAADNRPDEAAHWNTMLAGGPAVVIPPHQNRRIIIDAGTYVCAYPFLQTTGGRGSHVRAYWVESLLDALPGENQWVHKCSKGDRAAVDGKFFWGYPRGVGDEFLPDGGKSRHFSTLWWEAGRFVEITVVAADEALTIEAFGLEETHYPFDFTATFDSSEPRLARVATLGLRTIEMCGHETYMDCPYFEQLQYIGDTRLQALVTYVSTSDARLPRKAIEAFDASRDTSGLTQSRYPSSHFQRIAPFSLWWVAMVHDYAMWRDDADFIRARLPGIRAVLDAYAAHVTSDGLLGPIAGWNFVDWVPGWKMGTPKDADRGISGVLCWQFAWVLRLASELEAAFGEPEIAELQRRRAAALAAATVDHFFCPDRGAMADDLGRSSWSEHGQCLALLSGMLPPETSARVVEALLTLPDLHRATIYFSHYLFDVLRLIRGTDRILGSMGAWYDLLVRNLSTTVEMPEPTRSDCHAWGAHPVYHFHASILGVRPGELGFKSVNVRPQLGGLTFAKGVMPHPLGDIRSDFTLNGGRLTGTVELPPGVSGRMVTVDGETMLNPGLNRVESQASTDVKTISTSNRAKP